MNTFCSFSGISVHDPEYFTIDSENPPLSIDFIQLWYGNLLCYLLRKAPCQHRDHQCDLSEKFYGLNTMLI